MDGSAIISPLMNGLLENLHGKFTKQQLETLNAAIKTKNNTVLQGYLNTYGVKDDNKKEMIAGLLIENAEAVYKLKPKEDDIVNDGAITDVFASIPQSSFDSKEYNNFSPLPTGRSEGQPNYRPDPVPIDQTLGQNDVNVQIGDNAYTVKDIQFTGNNKASAKIAGQKFDVLISKIKEQGKVLGGGSKKHKFTSKRHGGSKNSHKFTNKRYGGKKHHKFTSKRHGGKKHSRRH